MNINYFKINIPKGYIVEGFKNEIIYENIICNNFNFHNIRKEIIRDKIKIKKLIGNRGIILEKELQ